MTLQELKLAIETNNIPSQLFIFEYSDNNFLAVSYMQEISRQFNRSIRYLESETDLQAEIAALSDIFHSPSINEQLVYFTDSFSFTDSKLAEIKNLIIVTHKIDKQISAIFPDNIIIFPKLEQWQITDYLYQTLPGVQKSKLDSLLVTCNYDVFRVSSEAEKLKIFDQIVQDALFDLFVSSGAFSDRSQYDIFNFTDALIHKNICLLKTIYEQKNSIDIEAIGLVTILYKNFRNIINVQLSNNPTPEGTGLTSKQIYAIQKYNCGYFSVAQLLKIFEFLTTIDLRIKTGELPVDMLIDYLIVKIFCI